MFVSFTDWEFDGNVDNAVESAKGFWPEMKKHGAVNMRATVTGEKTLRTMTVWSDQKKKCWKQTLIRLEPRLVLLSA